MSLKKILKNIQINNVKKIYEERANVINYEGYPAFKREGLERLKEILFLGTTGNTFYTDGYTNLISKIEDLKKLIAELDPDIIKDLIVEARGRGFFRHIPIIALAILRVYYPNKFKEIFNNIIITGQDLSDFLTINRALGLGFGRSVKDSINEWLKKVDSFYAIKYRRHINDAIRISRPKVDLYPNKDILGYAYSIGSKKVEINNEQIKNAEMFKKAIKDGKFDEALKYAKDGRLPADLIIALAGNHEDPYLWEIIAENMGLNQFLKYLNKLSKIIEYTKLVDMIKRRITIENLEKAKIFPFAIFIAASNITSFEIRSYLMTIADEYIKKFDFSKWNRYTWAICPDISSSMKGKYSKIAGFFSGVLAKGTGTDYIYMWNTRCIPLKTTNLGVYSIYENIVENTSGMTTMGSPIEYLTKNQIKKDFVVMITDSEHWYGGYDDTFMSRWLEYKNIINKKAKAIIIEIAGYGHSQVDEEFANKYDVFTIFGWNNLVIDWIEQKILKEEK